MDYNILTIGSDFIIIPEIPIKLKPFNDSIFLKLPNKIMENLEPDDIKNKLHSILGKEISKIKQEYNKPSSKYEELTIYYPMIRLFSLSFIQYNKYKKIPNKIIENNYNIHFSLITAKTKIKTLLNKNYISDKKLNIIQDISKLKYIKESILDTLERQYKDPTKENFMGFPIEENALVYLNYELIYNLINNENPIIMKIK